MSAIDLLPTMGNGGMVVWQYGSMADLKFYLFDIEYYYRMVSNWRERAAFRRSTAGST